MLARGVNAPLTSSVGRLFDAVASILGLRQRVSFEGQAAMELEFAIAPGVEDSYPFGVEAGASFVVDWQPMILELLEDTQVEMPAGLIAAKFHNTLAGIVVAVARRAGLSKIALTGGCFQNKYLLERTVRQLRAGGFHPYWHQRIPTNDGGISLGQVIAAVRAQHAQAAPAEECVV